MDVPTLVLLSIPLLTFVQFNTLLPSWGSRKVLHMGTGTLLIFCDVHDPLFRLSTYVVTVVAILVVCSTKLHFTDMRDVGVSTYLLICSACVALRIPLIHLAPFFYADPMGAIVGLNIHTTNIVGDKSLAGTIAVFATSALTLGETHLSNKIATALLLAIIELVCGKWDNMAIGLFLLAHSAYNRDRNV